MYKAYFGLSDNPFSITPDPRYLYLSPRHKEALAHLLYGITQRGGFIQLTGEVGTGKTTLTRALLEQLPENTDLALILNPKVSIEEFLASVCEEFRIIESGTKLSIKEYVDKLTEFLLEQYSKGLHTVVLIDEAQNLTFDVIEQVRLLTNIETSKSKLLQIILVGQPELVEHLNNRKLRQVAQRVTARYHLIPLNMSETAGYIKHRLRVGGVERPIFTPGAMRLIKLYSGGIPRLINIICDRALLGAYASNKIQVDSKIVTKAAMEVKGGKLFDFGAPIRALKNKFRSRSNVKTNIDLEQIDVEVKPIAKVKAKDKVENKTDKKKPRRVVKVKKVSSKNASSAVSVSNSLVVEDPAADMQTPVDSLSMEKTIISESEDREVKKIEDELERKQEEKIADDKAAIAVGELEQERVSVEQEAEKAEQERLEAERLEAERIAAEKAEQERLEAERLEAERIAAEKAEQERLEAERLEAERIAAEKAEQERLEAERLETERIAAEKAEQERLEAERLETERIAAEKAEQERLEAERLEAERIAAEKAEQERLEAERLEAERIAAEKAEQERLEAERLEAERIAAEKAEQERLESEQKVENVTEDELQEKVEAMFSEDAASDESGEEKLASDVEFGEIVEDFDDPGKQVQLEDEPTTEIDNFDIYAAEDSETEEEKHLYDSEDLEEEIDDDIAIELKDEDYQDPSNESEILKGEESSTSKLKSQIQEQVKEKAAKAAKVAGDGIKAGAKFAEAGVKAGAVVGAKLGDKIKNGWSSISDAKLGDKVKNSVSSIKLEESIAKVQSLGKKEKIFVGAFAVVLMLAVMTGVFMPGGENTVSSEDLNGHVANAEKQNATKAPIDSPKDSNKSKPVNNVAVVSEGKTKLQPKSKATIVNNDSNKVDDGKLTNDLPANDPVDNAKTTEQQAASLSKMVSSLQGLFGNDTPKKSEDNIEETKVDENKDEAVSSGGENIAPVQQVAKVEDKKVEQVKPDAVNTIVSEEKIVSEKKVAQEVKKQVIKRSKLEKALLSKSLNKSLVSSFRELFKLWRFDYDKTKGKTACEKSKTKGLNCFFNTGSVEQLIRFNRPVIMKFKKNKGFDYALLVKLSNASVTLDFAGEFKKFSTKDLKSVWDGKYITVWRPPKLSKMVIKPGEKGDHVRWLSMMMDMYDGKKTPRIDRKIYNDALKIRVEAFQKDFHLQVDGIVGKSTMAYMTSAVSFPGVPLLKNDR